jgi:chloramphenicol 3-O-phosphotransferase
MSFENLVFILKNYAKYGYKNVIVNDLLEPRIKDLAEELNNYSYKIVTLIVSDNEVLKKRVLDETRDSGYRNYERAIEWNTHLMAEKSLENEIKIDNTYRLVRETVFEIVHN